MDANENFRMINVCFCVTVCVFVELLRVLETPDFCVLECLSPPQEKRNIRGERKSKRVGKWLARRDLNPMYHRPRSDAACSLW